MSPLPILKSEFRLACAKGKVATNFNPFDLELD